MARYDKDHKGRSRQRIIESAGRHFKRDGIDGSGVATVMKDAGMTNGAFYGHFDSKDDLVATAIGEELRMQREVFVALEPGPAGVEQFIRAYLSVEHRDGRAEGCPSAALLDEIGRCVDGTRRSYSEGILAIVDDLADRLTRVEPSRARLAVLAMFASMVGTIQLSRALTDRRLADDVLSQGVENALESIRRTSALLDR